jgi:hypothetical protein
MEWRGRLLLKLYSPNYEERNPAMLDALHVAFHIAWICLFPIAVFLITRQDIDHSIRYLLIGLVLALAVGSGYEIVRLVGFPKSHDILDTAMFRAFTVAVLGEMAKDKLFPRPVDEAVMPQEKVMYAVLAIIGIPCIVLTFVWLA